MEVFLPQKWDCYLRFKDAEEASQLLGVQSVFSIGCMLFIQLWHVLLFPCWRFVNLAISWVLMRVVPNWFTVSASRKTIAVFVDAGNALLRCYVASRWFGFVVNVGTRGSNSHQTSLTSFRKQLIWQTCQSRSLKQLRKRRSLWPKHFMTNSSVCQCSSQYCRWKWWRRMVQIACCWLEIVWLAVDSASSYNLSE